MLLKTSSSSMMKGANKTGFAKVPPLWNWKSHKPILYKGNSSLYLH